MSAAARLPGPPPKRARSTVSGRSRSGQPGGGQAAPSSTAASTAAPTRSCAARNGTPRRTNSLASAVASTKDTWPLPRAPALAAAARRCRPDAARPRTSPAVQQCRPDRRGCLGADLDRVRERRRLRRRYRADPGADHLRRPRLEVLEQERVPFLRHRGRAAHQPVREPDVAELARAPQLQVGRQPGHCDRETARHAQHLQRNVARGNRVHRVQRAGGEAEQARRPRAVESRSVPATACAPSGQRRIESSARTIRSRSRWRASATPVR